MMDSAKHHLSLHIPASHILNQPQIVHAGELSDEVAGMTNLASSFSLNTLIKTISTISKFFDGIVALQIL